MVWCLINLSGEPGAAQSAPNYSPSLLGDNFLGDAENSLCELQGANPPAKRGSVGIPRVELNDKGSTLKRIRLKRSALKSGWHRRCACHLDMLCVRGLEVFRTVCDV